MKGRLFYIVGPSGSGKDSLLDYARARVSRDVHFARRTITRPAASGGENHIAVTAPEFDRLLAAGAFAMHWRANGHDYGIGREIVPWLKKGHTVVVSGSRAHLPKALAGFPDLRVVAVTASEEILRARLARRGREDPGAIEARLARASALKLPAGVTAYEIVNDGEISHAGSRLLGLLA
jgi:ribose 1,5-bisphosphokinase